MPRLMHRAREEGVPVPETTAREQGVVTYHTPEKGYGKIDGAGVEYFFHITHCSGRFHQLTEGTPVTFVGRMTEKGLRAFEVQQDTSPHREKLDAADTRGNR